MLQNNTIKCKCGNCMILEMESLVKIRVVCGKCNTVIIDQISAQFTPNETAKKPTSRYQNSYQQVEEIKDQEKQTKIDQYILMKQLGSGAMGKVFLAMDEQTREQVALKFLNKNSDNVTLDYFIRETQLLMSLDHPNIINLKGWGNYAGSPYIAMEYVSGDTLEKVLQKGAISPKYAIQIMLQVLNALAYGIQYHIIHRDIKPSNIILGPNKLVKLIDFGIGKALGDQQELTKTGQMIGTAYYMPPEQLKEAKSADYRADVYSVGATLFHALCGHAPFEEHGKNMLKILVAKQNNNYLPLSQIHPHLPKEIIAIVEKTMAYDPHDRYCDAEEMKNALGEVYRNSFSGSDF